MATQSRRRFLSDVGAGMLVAGLGSGLATDLGISVAGADEADDRLTFGKLEPLVDLMHQSPVEELQPALVQKLQSGVDLKTLITAGALANARCFGGQDYTGFHTMMALMPAWQMAQELPSAQQALPVLKVLYRNTARIQETGRNELLRKIQPADLSSGEPGGARLFHEMCKADFSGAESSFAALAGANPADAYNDLQHMVQDEGDVHRVTLAWRAWAILPLTGKEHAQTLLRQSVRYCVESERRRLEQKRAEPELRSLIPRLLDEYKLLQSSPGTRRADVSWLDKTAREIFGGQRAHAAEVIAAALAENFHVEDIGEALALAANLLVLHDPGRNVPRGDIKPIGSVHGDSVGVHASDAANSWRNIARVTNHRNQVCSLLVGAWHTAGQSQWVKEEPFPFAERAKGIKSRDADSLTAQLHEAIRAKDQLQTCAVVAAAEGAGQPAAIFDVLRQYAVSEDGALHAEKYFRTVTEEFATARPEFRWRHLIGLGRVTASEFGWPAPGREQARELLRV